MEAGDRGIQSSEDTNQARTPNKTLPGSNSTRRPPPVPAAFKSLDNTAKSNLILTPSPAPQWPLRDDSNGQRIEKNTSPEAVNFSKRQAPQRPARPGNVPSLLDASKIHDYTPSIPYRQRAPGSSFQQPHPAPQSPEQNLMSPDNVSDTGSLGSIPDFPVPGSQIAQPTPAANGPSGRRNHNLGRPPATRRVASSYYSSASFVSPIPEESPETLPRKGGSFASSKVIPSSWGSAPPIADFRKSAELDIPGDGDDKPSDSLVRQASLGKRGKASLRTINKTQGDQSVDGNKDSKSRNNESSEKEQTTPTATVVSTGGKVVDPPQKDNNATDRSTQRHLDDYTSPETSDDEFEKPPIPFMGPESDTASVLKNEENGNFSAPTGTNQRKRPPRINIDAVREAEARGSLTSLPDLIRRATKLASNLDRGKTASRLGIMDIMRASNDNRSRNSGSISDILASFPPPGIATPSGGDRWPGPFTSENSGPCGDLEKGRERRRRRCYGMPLWAVILTCVLGFALVAAAVIVPIAFTVLPRANQESQPSSAPVSNCQNTDPCMNGGISVGNPGSCGCVCVDGFRGDRCGFAGDSSCTTMNLANEPSRVQNATLGNAIPRLFEDSEADFNIPLNKTRLLRLFNGEDMSCTSQNALVTFNGASRKRNEQMVPQAEGVLGGPDETILPSPAISREGIDNANDRKPNILGRQVGEDDSPAPAQTDSPDPPKTNPKAPLQPNSSAPAPAPTGPKTPSLPPLTPKLFDFSRIAVLFIFEQTEDVADAVSAHDSIQSFFQDPAGESGRQRSSMGVNSGAQNYTLDFIGFTIRLDNGTIVGGK
ncbi:hypothetical protein AJ79_05401 [Helicocarpus griseus UAMH5409]|uniref:EGF-like domain-containing protein n=1 Tax=Helicocarpus griseus UAMH5409 TaxID=1447875 RepID=A0A2B7XNM5_9EURO|nr:hypothetical protein AJ79_05401 [Helicocarpus griseus UAMH5409]